MRSDTLESPPAMPLRRLSDEELDHTIEDVFDLDLLRRAPSATGHGFDNQVDDQFVGSLCRSTT